MARGKIHKKRDTAGTKARQNPAHTEKETTSDRDTSAPIITATAPEIINENVDTANVDAEIAESTTDNSGSDVIDDNDSDEASQGPEELADNAVPSTGDHKDSSNSIQQDSDVYSGGNETDVHDLSAETARTYPIRKSRHISLIVLAVILLSLIGGYQVVFANRAAPGVQLAGQNASGKNLADLKALAVSQATLVKLNLKTATDSEIASPTEVGIKFDAAKTAQNALQAKKTSLLDRLQFWQKQNTPLVYTLNREAFSAYTQKHLIEGWKLPVDAKLAFNPETKQYEVIAPQSGEGINMSIVKKSLDEAAAGPKTVSVAIEPVPTHANIGKTAAETAQKKANAYLKSDIQMFHGGKRVFYFEPQEIDTLLDIIPKPQAKTIEVSVNQDRVQQFVDTDVTSTIARAARDQVVIINPETGTRVILQEGVKGQKLIANEKLASNIKQALTTGKAYHPEIDVEEGGYGEQVYTGVNRWAEVNLTRQEAYMRLDDKIIQTFRISSGRAATPSDPGEWAVTRKLPITTMRGTINGESYVVPDVPWVAYFNPDAEAFHGAYWHNNFGTPMSHGCINMTIPDARMMYNFAYIGMRVSVHY